MKSSSYISFSSLSDNSISVSEVSLSVSLIDIASFFKIDGISLVCNKLNTS